MTRDLTQKQFDKQLEKYGFKKSMLGMGYDLPPPFAHVAVFCPHGIAPRRTILAELMRNLSVQRKQAEAKRRAV